MLAAVGNERAALPWRPVDVTRESLGQPLFTGTGAELALRAGEAAGHEGTEALAATEKINVIPLTLKLKGLLQGAKPGFNSR
jgi:hypothetical protein